MSKKSKASSAKKSNTKKTVKSAGAKKAVKSKKTASVKKPAAKKPASDPKKKSASSKAPLKKAKVIAKKPVAKLDKKLSSKAAKAAPVSKSKVSESKIDKKSAAKAVQTPVKNLPVKKSPVIEKTEEKAEPIVKKQAETKNTNNEVLAITNTIPKTNVTPISASKIASISSSITNPIKKVDSYSVKVEKEPNGKFELEFVVRSSPEMLFEFLSSPSGLSEWFCDDVNIRNGIYTFIWDGTLQQARLLKTHDDQLVRFQWVEKTDGSYFEFRIQRDDLTNDISLIITDFADTNSEKESAKRLWQSQVEKLLHIIGSIF